MPARLATDVLVGPGQMWTAPLATAFPANAETAPAGTWVDVGYSDQGAAFEIASTFENVEVAEEAEPINTRWTTVQYQFVIALAQILADTLKTILNGGTLTAIPGPPQRRTLTPPALGADVAVALLFRFVNHKAPFHSDLQCPKVYSIAQTSIGFRKAPQKSIAATTFRLAKPSSGSIWTLDEYIAAA